MTSRCSECGVAKGQAHHPTCFHAQKRRRPGFGKLTGNKCPPHNPAPVKGRNKDDTSYYQCSKCKKKLGRW